MTAPKGMVALCIPLTYYIHWGLICLYLVTIKYSNTRYVVCLWLHRQTDMVCLTINPQVLGNAIKRLRMGGGCGMIYNRIVIDMR